METTSQEDRVVRSRQPLLLLAVVFGIVALVNAGMALTEPTPWQWATAGVCVALAAVLLSRRRDIS
jgi:hypothetical protein